MLNRIWTFPGKQVRREAEALDPAVLQRRARSRASTTSTASCRSTRTDTVVGQHHARSAYGVDEPRVPQAGGRRPVAGDPQRDGRAELLHGRAGRALRPVLPDQLQRHRTEQVLAALDRRAGAADRLHDGELTAPSTTRSSTRSARWRPTARSTGSDGCRRARAGASAGSSRGCPGSTIPTRLDHYINGLTNVRLKQNRYGAMYQFNYDLLRGSFLQQRMMAYYNAQCCGFARGVPDLQSEPARLQPRAEGQAAELLVHTGGHRHIRATSSARWAGRPATAGY